jgi:hypothetical protein
MCLGGVGVAELGWRSWGGGVGVAELGWRIWGGGFGVADLGWRIWGGSKFPHIPFKVALTYDQLRNY